MKRLLYLSSFLLLLLAIESTGQKNSALSSPDGQINFKLTSKKTDVSYSVSFKNTPLIGKSPLSLTFLNDPFFEKGVVITKVTKTSGRENYELPLGKTSKVTDDYNESIFTLKEMKAGRSINLHVKIYDDAVAFRYELPGQDNWKNYELINENSSFNLLGNPEVTAAFLENYTTSHEHRYNVLTLEQVPDTLIELPALFKFPKNVYMSITEANLRNYAGMSLRKRNGVLYTQLTPLPGQQETKVKADLPHHTPWRVIMISDRPGAFIESNVLTSLCEPTTVTDFSWLKPGKASFHWWSGDVLPDTTFEAGVNFNFNKYYIDFCARNGIEYHTVIGNRGVAWYQNDGNEYQPGPGTDILKTRASLNMKQVCDYAKSKGVGIRVWVHWKPLYDKLDSAFTQFEKWGIRGMMVDFMDRDDQEMVNIQEEILLGAVKHHLEIQFHGSFKPTGLSRTFPNESTREGTLNYENDKWGILITPDDDINVVFTRLLAGSTDYHLGGFNAMPADKFKQQMTRPHVLGTRCHMLAMYVVLENHVSMICDYPEAYEGQPGFDFLQQVPTVWDETVVPAAEVGQWVSVARRKGEDWYLAAITNNKERSVSIPLNFLSKVDYTATIYSDSKDVSTEPNHLNKEVKQIDGTRNLQMHLAEGGGQVIIFRKQH